jgi:hypothetical protein
MSRPIPDREQADVKDKVVSSPSASPAKQQPAQGFPPPSSVLWQPRRLRETSESKSADSPKDAREQKAEPKSFQQSAEKSGKPDVEQKALLDDNELKELLGDDGSYFIKTDKELDAVLRFVEHEMKVPIQQVSVFASGGVSLTFVCDTSDFVLQHYLNADAMKGVQSVFAAMKSNKEEYGAEAAQDLKHLAEVTDILPDLRIAKMEKLVPLNTIYKIGASSTAKRPASELFGNDDEMKKLRGDVHQGIQSLADFSSLRTNDEVIDNVGVKKGTGDYALFDYNLAKNTTGSGEAKQKFDESLQSAMDGEKKGDKGEKKDS